ncbi:MAG: hypothetical protein HZA24_05940 [Nitrospirae bacterium]|nr:hypothetical protein [Nitrospirota bacterium]
MTPHWCLTTAFRNLDSALSDLRAGRFDSACDHIASGAYWAMEYWLKWHGLDGPHGNGWATVRQAFLNALDEGDPLRGLTLKVFAAQALERPIFGLPPDNIPTTEWHGPKWRDDVAALAQATIALVDRMPVPPECPQTFRLSLDPAFDDAQYHLIEWQGAHLFCTYHNPYLRTVHPSLLVPGFERWPRFWQIADRIGLWHWPRRFDPDTGTDSPIPRWRLEITHNGRTLHTEAPAQFPTDRRVAALFQAVERVLDVPVYW